MTAHITRAIPSGRALAFGRARAGLVGFAASIAIAGCAETAPEPLYWVHAHCVRLGHVLYDGPVRSDIGQSLRGSSYFFTLPDGGTQAVYNTDGCRFSPIKEAA